MPRQPRVLLSKSYYHIMTRGNNRHTVFHEPEDYQKYLELLEIYKADQPFDLFHYCLMPNHVHMLIRTDHAQDFSKLMKRLNLAYFHYYNSRYGWVGHFWQDRFKSQPVGKDGYFIQCGKYIELNPVRAKLVEKPEDYPFSSFAFYASGLSNKLITADIFYNDFGQTDQERRFNYRKLVIDNLIESTYEKNVWGSGYQAYQETKKKKYHLGNV